MGPISHLAVGQNTVPREHSFGQDVVQKLRQALKATDSSRLFARKNAQQVGQDFPQHLPSPSPLNTFIINSTCLAGALYTALAEPEQVRKVQCHLPNGKVMSHLSYKACREKVQRKAPGSERTRHLRKREKGQRAGSCPPYTHKPHSRDRQQPRDLETRRYFGDL